MKLAFLKWVENLQTIAKYEGRVIMILSQMNAFNQSFDFQRVPTNYADFGTWKKPGYAKFALVGL